MKFLFVFLFFFLILLSNYTVNSRIFRGKRQAALATDDGIDIPFTLRSAITCLTPGILENICLGPRVQVLKKERIGLTDRKGATYGYHNGVDVRLLRNKNIPLIGEDTEIGRSIGATVDVTPWDGALEVGTRDKIFNVWKHNKGALVEWDQQGAGFDIGSRASAADDLIKLRHTLFGLNIGPNSQRNIVGPYRVGDTKGQHLKVATPIQSLYHNYYAGRGDWYKNQFRRPGDQYRTNEQKACPWCFAVDSTYPTQTMFNPIFTGRQ
ncbi:unnamed protein product [Caenorhabditis angaria]|uniref:Uncharacterized protein n=1 Tax=Caenorhabditis angaria TaxID=860376 RepID=A0A9P1IKJ9_9PELO|nr:unnamed protein product [Caenorhabditis angaria]